MTNCKHWKKIHAFDTLNFSPALSYGWTCEIKAVSQWKEAKTVKQNPASGSSGSTPEINLKSNRQKKRRRNTGCSDLVGGFLSSPQSDQLQNWWCAPGPFCSRWPGMVMVLLPHTAKPYACVCGWLMTNNNNIMYYHLNRERKWLQAVARWGRAQTQSVMGAASCHTPLRNCGYKV